MIMQAQKAKLSKNKYIWLVLDDNLLPIAPVESYMEYLYNTEKSPSTLQSYANHLKLFWDYLAYSRKNWQKITIADFADFIHWLRSNNLQVIHIDNNNPEIRRSERTVNTILSALASFYRYHNQLGNTEIKLVESYYLPANRHKTLLYHIHKSKPVWKRIISLKEPKGLIKTLSPQQVKLLIDSCSNIRDRFLIALLYETGMRIGQALGLQHSGIKSWDNEIEINYRVDNVNHAYGKSKCQNIICVSSKLMDLYTNYLNKECDLVSTHEYVFINYLTNKPLPYSSIRSLFKKLRKKTAFYVTPHMLRHTHATELINCGWDPALVQKRLGHSSVQTTIDTYTHINHQEMKKHFAIYQNKRREISYGSIEEKI